MDHYGLLKGKIYFLHFTEFMRTGCVAPVSWLSPHLSETINFYFS
jgi:hypothetical protein